jgi:hypothetical protein
MKYNEIAFSKNDLIQTYSQKEKKEKIMQEKQEKNGLLVLPTIHNIDEIVRGLSTPMELTKGKYSNLEFRFTNNTVSLMHDGLDLRDFENVWLTSYWPSRDLAYSVKLYLDHYATPHTFVEKATSKVSDQMIFALNNISTPNTFFIDNLNIWQYIEPIESTCGYPLIIKDITGSGGRHSYYIKDRIDLLEKSALLPKHKKYLYQKFIPNDFDWGILVSNGMIVSAEKSYPKECEFRNNSCNGAAEVFVDIATIPLQVKEMALEASAALGLVWSRADIVVDRETEIPYLMEVNRCPGISSGTSEVLGAREFLETHLGLPGVETKEEIIQPMTEIVEEVVEIVKAK